MIEYNCNLSDFKYFLSVAESNRKTYITFVFLRIRGLTSVTYAGSQKNNSKQARKSSVNVSKVAPAIAVAIQQLPADLKLKAAQAFLKTEVKIIRS